MVSILKVVAVVGHVFHVFSRKFLSHKNTCREQKKNHLKGGNKPAKEVEEGFETLMNV